MLEDTGRQSLAGKKKSTKHLSWMSSPIRR